jgi:TolB-like protein
MRHWIVSAAVLLISSSFALAQAPEPTRVLVAPFTELNEQQQPDWISRAVRQSVVDELAALSEVEVAPNNEGAVTPTTAQAKALGLKYIVRATIQRLNGEIRVTGRVEDVETGKTAGGFKATGPQHQLFAIEDSLGRQLKRIVAPMQAEPAGLEDARPMRTGSTHGGAGPQTPIQPIRGVYEGSDLQRAIQDRDYLRRTQRRIPDDYTYTPPPTYYPPPSYPGGYGYGYGYGYGSGWPGWGYPSWGWNDRGDNNVVIINPGTGNGGNGGSVGGGGGGSVVRPHLPTIQTQRLRDAAVNPGQSGNFIGPAPARAPHPGTIKK